MTSIKYLTEGLANADYYRDNQITSQLYKGNLAVTLGLDKTLINTENFTSLYGNHHPTTGEQITPVMAKDRKPYYDFTFSAPKSVSILWSLTDSKKLHNEITRLFAESVTESMDFAQKRFAVARDKRNKQTIYNNTDSLIYIDFLHDTSRPINGIPDMHLHTHCAVFNMTYDDTIGGFKAMEFRDFAKYRNQIEAYHHSTLAKKLMTIGIDIRNTYNSFEVSEINRDLIDLYSNRSILIEDFAKQKGIIDPIQKGSLGAKLREKKQTKLTKIEVNKLWCKRMDNGQKRLISSLTDKSLLQITDNSSLILLQAINNNGNNSSDAISDTGFNLELIPNAKQELTTTAINQSINHFLERQTVADRNNVLTYALNTNLKELNFINLEQKLNKLQTSRAVNQLTIKKTLNITTPEVIKQELEIITIINKSLGNYQPILINPKVGIDLTTLGLTKTALNSMSKDQSKVFYQVLGSNNSIDYINGDAGAGKTYLLQNLKPIIQNTGKTLHAYAPTSIAGRKVLRDEVTQNADTVQMLLINQSEQQKINSQSVVVIDEAGLLSYQDMNKLLRLQSQKEFKLILLGDTKQHNSVLRGDGLRIIETKTNLKPFKLTTNQRQKSNLDYQNAINLLANQKPQESLKAFEDMGALKEIPNSTKRYNQIADDYVKYLIANNQTFTQIDPKLEVQNQDPKNSLSEAKQETLNGVMSNLPSITNNELKMISNKLINNLSTKDILVVTPTHQESEIITNRIRKRLIKHNLIGKENIKVKTLVDKGLTDAQKQNKLIYENCDVLVATQNTKHLKIGKEYQITIGKDYVPTIKVQAKDNKCKQLTKIIELPYQDSSNFTVNRIKEIELSKGDTINITSNSFSTTETRLLKGARHQIKSITTDQVTKQPVIKLDNDQILKPDFKNLRHGYTTTSYSSQGLTVKHLIVAQAEVSLPASSFQQAYVSLSRGKTSVSLYTDNKQSLEKAMSVSKTREIVVGLRF